MSLSPDVLARVGEALYGPTWQSDMARDLGVAVRTVQRWADGSRTPADGVRADLARIVRLRRHKLGKVLLTLT